MNDEQTVEALNGMWSNYCVTDAFEPGSVVKPIVMAGALEKGKISETDTFLCDGLEIFGANGETPIKCAVYPDAHGTETLGEVIANSCNDGMMQIGAKMGSEQFIKAQSLFNFGARTGIDLPNEGSGIIHTKDTMGETEHACSAGGQGYTCTMIQEINALCSVINGGYYYQPHLVTKIKDANGGIVKTFSPTLLKQTISSNISADIRSYMELSVQQGTSHYSKVQGYSSGGKTGTAEKFPRGNGKYLVSFIGFAPVEEPEVVIYVVVTMGETELACSAFGQGYTCTMIQEINALCSVINGGYYYQPHLVTKIKDANGGIVKTFSPTLLKQTISSNISADIRSYMELSVQQGTSHYSKVQGYSSGGKTGTAEKFPRGNGKYLVSFIGFAPVEEPEVVIYVVVDEPNTEDQATSRYPQYIAQGILSELLPYLNIAPDEITDGTVPQTELWEGFAGYLKNPVGSNVDENGNLVDDKGNRIDWDGNRIDENGYLLNEDGSYQVNENGEYIKSENLGSYGNTEGDGYGRNGSSDRAVGRICRLSEKSGWK